MHGFLICVNKNGVIIVISENVQAYLGYSELQLLGNNILAIISEEDVERLGQLLVLRPNTPGLLVDPVQFIVKFKKLTRRSEPEKHYECYVEGALRKADRVCKGLPSTDELVLATRVRVERLSCSNYDEVVFIGVVRPSVETFITERELEAFTMEYKMRQSFNGVIIQVESKVTRITGYEIKELLGHNMNQYVLFEDLPWIYCILSQVIDNSLPFYDTCYRVVSKEGKVLYMRTRGIVVDELRTIYTSINSVVDETQGQQMMETMKNSILTVSNTNEPPAPQENPLCEERITDHQLAAASVDDHQDLGTSKQSGPKKSNDNDQMVVEFDGINTDVVPEVSGSDLLTMEIFEELANTPELPEIVIDDDMAEWLN